MWLIRIRNRYCCRWGCKIGGFLGYWCHDLVCWKITHISHEEVDFFPASHVKNYGRVRSKNDMLGVASRVPQVSAAPRHHRWFGMDTTPLNLDLFQIWEWFARICLGLQELKVEQPTFLKGIGLKTRLRNMSSGIFFWKALNSSKSHPCVGHAFHFFHFVVVRSQSF